MNEPEREGAELLGPLRGFEPAAPGSVDVACAMRSGRRRIRARRAAGAAAGVAAVALAVVPAALLGRTVGDGQRPAAPPAGEFRPGHREFSVGSAGGYTPSSYDPGRLVQRIALRPAVPGGPLRGGDGLVEMYPRGGRTPAGGTAAPPVHGHRALYLGTPAIRPGAVELAWEWRPGAWGFVSLKGNGADRTRAHRVALSVLPAGRDAPAPSRQARP